MREWLNAQAAGGYVTYDPADAVATRCPPSRRAALADESSPFFLCGAFQVFTSLVRDEPKIREAFTSGAGVGWHEHHHELFEGTERFFRTGYAAHLVASGSPRSTASRTSCAPACAWPTSAAASAPRRSSWRRRSPPRSSSASTTTRSRSRPRASAPRMRA